MKPHFRNSVDVGVMQIDDWLTPEQIDLLLNQCTLPAAEEVHLEFMSSQRASWVDEQFEGETTDRENGLLGTHLMVVA